MNTCIYVHRDLYVYIYIYIYRFKKKIRKFDRFLHSMGKQVDDKNKMDDNTISLCAQRANRCQTPNKEEKKQGPKRKWNRFDGNIIIIFFWRTGVCHSYLWHGWSIGFICFMRGISHLSVIWLNHMCHDSLMCDVCDMADQFGSCDGFMRGITHLSVTWLIHMCHDSLMCDMTHSYMSWLIYRWHDSFKCHMTHSHVPWLINVWHVWHGWSICFMWRLHAWHISFKCDMTHSQVPCHL